MKSVLIVAIAGALGCGAAAPSPAPAPPPLPPPAPSLADMTDAMCACKTPACADKVHTDFAAVSFADEKTSPPHVLALRAYVKTCEETARQGDDQTTLDAMRDEMCACKDAACVDKVQKHYAPWMQKMDDKYGADKKPPEALMKSAMAMSQCMSNATQAGGGAGTGAGAGLDGVGGTESAPPPPTTADDDDEEDPPPPPPEIDLVHPDTGVRECDAYLRTGGKYMACKKVPQQAKDAMMQGLEQMNQGFAMLKDPNVPAEAKKAAADACKQGTAALKQSAKAMGCKL